MNKKVLVALSGGVDSTVCALLLKEQGFDVSAVVMKMSDLHEATVDAAKEAADHLNIPLTVLDLRTEFEQNVISYFVDEYLHGRTPNPCVVCNPKVKFFHLLKEADRQNCDFAATGHYARLEHADDGSVRLLKSLSLARDQSYMLYRLTQKELSRLIFPLSDWEKPKVREYASAHGLTAAKLPDSEENCFVEGKDYAAFIQSRVGTLPPGDFIAPNGSVCGKHQGIAKYTVGQRKGLGIALGRPVFIREIDPVQNRIYLADAGQDTFSAAVLSDVTTISGVPFSQPFTADVKIRSAATPSIAQIFPSSENRLKVIFPVPIRAVAKGQSIVIYDGDAVLGGGFIEETEK